MNARVRNRPASRGLIGKWKTLPLAAQLGGFTLVVMLLLAALSHYSLREQEAIAAGNVASIAHLQRIQLVAAQLEMARANMDARYQRYLASGDTMHLRTYAVERARLERGITELRGLHSRDPAVVAGIDAFAAAHERWEEATDREAASLHGMRGSGGRAAPGGQLAENAQLMEDARAEHRRLTALIARAAGAGEERAQALADELSRRTRAYWAGVLILVLVLVLIIARDIAGTLNAIVRGAHSVAEGNFGGAMLARTAPSSREVQELSVVFDDLARAVADREQGLHDHIKKLTEVEQLKRDFVATVSHELRTPLTSIRGALGLLVGGAGGKISGPTHELIRIALQNTERLIRLINDILDVEKIESGQVTLKRDECSVQAILEQTISALAPYAAEHSVTMTLEASTPATVTGDEDRLIQVFTNIISNAVKFSGEGTQVRVRLGTTADCARVTVTDTGAGIPLEFQERIFGRFAQAARPGTTGKGGTGLGLAIARSIVELHDGIIGFESREGSGTTFHVELPLAGHQRVLANVTERQDVDRVLIVEDDPLMLNVLRAMCESVAAVTGVQSAEAAWDAALREQYDALIVDPGLPGASGFELVRRLREQPDYEGTPVLIFSGEEHSAEELAKHGIRAVHVFVKTRDTEQELVLRLRAVLAARRAHAGT